MDLDYSESTMVFNDSDFEEVWDEIKMIEHCEKIEKSQMFDSEDDEQLYDLCVLVEKTKGQSLQPLISTSSTSYPIQIGLGNSVKRSIELEDGNKDVKRTRVEEPSTSTDTAKVLCNICNVLASKRYFTNHIKSNLHKNNILKSHCSLDNVSVIDSAFRQRIISFKVKSKEQPGLVFQTPELFLESVRNDLCTLINETLKQHSSIKVNFVLYADFVQETKHITNSFDFQTNNFIISLTEDINIVMLSLRETLSNKISTFEKKDSGWSLKKINYIELNINKFCPLRGTSYILDLDLPKDIKDKKAVVNVKNSDEMCFKWALLSALYPVRKNSDRVSSYNIHSNKLKFNGIPFPIKLNDIVKVEKINNISVNVFGLEFDDKSKKHSVVGPLYFTKGRKNTHVNLLYIQNDRKGHYCYIKNLSRLVSKQISNTNGVVHICDGCLVRFTTQEKLTNHQQHDCFHITTNLPSSELSSKNWYGQPVSNKELKFNKFQKKFKIPFVVYADFEAFLKPIQTCSNDPSKSHSENIQKHEPYSFGYYIKCSFDDSLSKYETYSGLNCADIFLNRLHDDLKLICDRNYYQKSEPKPLTNSANFNIANSKVCHICETELNGDKTIDFDFQTGDFRGVVHELCGKKFRVPDYIPVFLHNLSNYDTHFIVHALNFTEGDIDLIPQNKEKYISFTKHLSINNKKINLRFVDSLDQTLIDNNHSHNVP